jgi:type VI secretion system protein ImpH
MASPSGKPLSGMIDRLKQEPYHFCLFQAMRLLESCHPDCPPIGTATRLRDEAVRFGQEPFLRFAPSDIQRFDPPTPERPARLVENAFGLLGPQGPMPLHVTQYIHDRIQNDGDHAFEAFLNVFHHRAISLFYRAWAVNQQAVVHARPEHDHFSRHIASLYGMGVTSSQDRDSVPDEAKLFFGGQLVRQVRNADGLQGILEGFFKLPTRIQELVGEWVDLPQESRCRLGASPETGVAGVSAVVGSRIWTVDQRIRIKFGPMAIKDYLRMLPSGKAFGRLADWIRLYTMDAFSWDVEFTLEKTELPSIQLGQFGCLGWTSWVKSQPLATAVVVVSGAGR